MTDFRSSFLLANLHSFLFNSCLLTHSNLHPFTRKPQMANATESWLVLFVSSFVTQLEASHNSGQNHCMISLGFPELSMLRFSSAMTERTL